ncbi:hypothetical protein [Mucilaginibacter gossypii]|uniref:Uncharacterized protein n=1 Tax=Mucilaginibacter gossypii TaxID=551996 RepID=A0A1G8B7R8_9SPHI|nr:hypothetical protein [Mucilaginibacter gossypii]SDH29043.1 hypothetical protein SAMN05192573_108115 [Mucilaginibacter gossypii]
MDRINIKCSIEGQEAELQLDKKAMPGEAGPCFMITANGCFKGYISRQKNGSYKSLGTSYYTNTDLQLITDQLSKSAQ